MDDRSKVVLNKANSSAHIIVPYVDDDMSSRSDSASATTFLFQEKLIQKEVDVDKAMDVSVIPETLKIWKRGQ